MAGAVQVGALVINMAADIASLKTNLAEATREAQTTGQKMAAHLGAVRTSLESAIAPLQSLTVKVGSLEAQMAKAKEAATSLAKGLIIGSAAGMSIEAIKGKLEGAIEAMAHLKELSEKTGSSVENLSKLGFYAKAAGTDVDSVASAMNKLTKGMMSADDETKGAGQALAFLGLSARDAAGNMKDPAVLFTEIAKKLDGYRDGAGKAAIAMTLFGKSGADMLPVMHEMAEIGDIEAKTTTAQAQAADQYQKDLAKLNAQKGALFKTLATSLLPTMSDFVNAMLDASKNTNIANSAVKDLAKDNSITDWADAAAMGTARLVDVIMMIPRALKAVSGSFKVVGTDISTLATIAVNRNNPAAIAMALAQREQVLADANQNYSDLWNYNGAAMEQAMAARIAARQKAAQVAASKPEGSAKPVLNFVNTDEAAAAAAAEKEVNAYATLTSAIRAKNDEIKLELATDQNLTEGQKLRIKIENELATSKVQLTAAHVAAVRAMLNEVDASEALYKARRAEKDSAAWIEQSTQARVASRAALEVEYAMYGKTADAREIAMIAVKNEAEFEKYLTEERKKGIQFTAEQLVQLGVEKDARTAVEQATLAQGKALGYASQLAQENKKFVADSILDEKARAAALLEIDADVWRERIRLAGAGTEAQKELQEQFNTWYANQAAKPFMDEQKKIWQSVEQTAHDTFISIFDSGKSAFNRLRDALKNGLLDLLYQMTVKKWIINIGTSVGFGGSAGMAQAGGFGGAGGAGGSSGMSSLIGAAQTANSMYKMVSGGMMDSAGSAIAGMGNMFGSSSMSAFGSGFAGNAAGMNMTASEMFSGMGMTSEASAASLGASAGAAAGVLGGIAGGIYGGRMVSGGYGSNGAVNTGTAIGAAVGSIVPVIGTALGALIGGLLGGAYNRMFGHKAPEVESQGLRGTFSGDTLTGSSYQNILEKGGWFASDKRYTESQAMSGDLLKQFSQGFTDLEKVSLGFANSLGVSADALKDYSKTFDITTTGDAAKDKQAITDFFTGVSEEIARKLVPNLDQFSKSGETASAALQRLAGDFQSTNQIAQLLGKSGADVFGSLGMDSATARERVIDLAGGVSVLAQQAQAYAQNYLTDAQRLAPVQKALDAAMASLGLSSVQTRDQFKAVIDGLDLTTEAGAKEFTSLMALSDAFAQVHPQIDAAAAAAQAAADAAKATADAAKAAADALQAMKDAASALTGDVDNAMSVLKTVADRQKAALQSRIDTEAAAITKLTSLSQSLRGALSSMTTPDQAAYDRAAAQAQVRTALAIARAGGPLPDADSLKTALSTLQKDSTGQFASYADYLRDYYSTKNDIASLAGITDDSLSVEQKSLDALNAQVKAIDQMVADAQAQVDVLKGIDSNGLTLIQAVEGVRTAILAANANPLVSGTSAINAAYQSALGRAPDAVGLAYWQKAIGNGASASDVTSAIANSPEATIQGMYQTMLHRPADAAGLNFWLTQMRTGVSLADIGNAIAGSGEVQGKIPGFATGGDFAGGWRLVGERGPELEATGPARIFNASQTSSLFSRLTNPSSNNDVLAAEVKALREDNRQMRQMMEAHLYAIAKNTRNTSDTLEGAARGQRPLQTAAV
jgi:biotin operon repressor